MKQPWTVLSMMSGTPQAPYKHKQLLLLVLLLHYYSQWCHGMSCWQFCHCFCALSAVTGVPEMWEWFLLRQETQLWLKNANASCFFQCLWASSLNDWKMAPVPLLLKVGPRNCRVCITWELIRNASSGFYPDLVNQNPHFNQIPRGLMHNIK